MNRPDITPEKIHTLLDAKFVRVFDIEYETGKHYFTATRHEKEAITALKSDSEFKASLPDAVTCIVIIKTPGEEPRLLLSYEYRYPTGQFLLSPPAGLIDKEDTLAENPLIIAAIREIYEETGITVCPSDRIFVANPLAFSTPGMSDESNALICAVLNLSDYSELRQDGAVGTERFDGFRLVTRDEALSLVQSCRDEHGNFFSLYTWSALMYFLSGMWEERK